MDESLKTAKRIVVKVGTSVLTEPGKDILRNFLRIKAARWAEVGAGGRDETGRRPAGGAR